MHSPGRHSAALAAISLIGLAARLAAAGSEVESLSKAESGSTHLGTNRIHYVRMGAGSNTVVFVHGWCGNLDHWRFQVPALKDRARLVLVDLPGHGSSDKPETAYTMEFFANAVDAVMKEAGVDQAVLAGFSMGASVICRYYRQFPNKVLALVAVDGALRGFDPTPQQREELIGRFRGPDYLDKARGFLTAMFPNAGTEALRDRVLEDAAKTPRYVMAGAFEGMFDKAAWEPSKIDVPLLVVNTRNPIWTADYEEHVRKLQPGVEYKVIDGTGHWVMQEKPAEVNAALIDFLQKNKLIKP
jgi:pimeloyl-ACP methyl ester carboxylesterase